MKDWYDLKDLKMAMLDSMLEMDDDSSVTDFVRNLISKLEDETDDKS